MEIYEILYEQLVYALTNRVKRDIKRGYTMESSLEYVFQYQMKEDHNEACMFGYLLGYGFAKTPDQCYNLLYQEIVDVINSEDE